MYRKTYLILNIRGVEVTQLMLLGNQNVATVPCISLLEHRIIANPIFFP